MTTRKKWSAKQTIGKTMKDDHGDRYAVMENLRDFLATFNPAEPLFLGHSFGEGQERFLSGGAGEKPEAGDIFSECDRSFSDQDTC